MLECNYGLSVIFIIIISLFGLGFTEKDTIYEIQSGNQTHQLHNWTIGNQSIFRVYLNTYVETGSILNFILGHNKLYIWVSNQWVKLISNTGKSQPIFIEHKKWYLYEIIFTKILVTLKLNGQSRTLKINPVTSVIGFNFGHISTLTFMSVGCAKNPTWNNEILKVSYNKIDRCSYIPRCAPKCINGACEYKQWKEIACVCRSGYDLVNKTICKPRICGDKICKNGGKCSYNNSILPNCICQNGFTGRSCSCPPKYCYHGTCYEDHLDEIKCKCRSDYFGKRCLCMHNFCSSRGKCIELENSTLACKCSRGNTGPNCLCNRNMCNHHGKCTQTSPSSFKCDCKPGYWGKTCACHQGLCSNGMCKDTNGYPKCVCKSGFTGVRCLCSTGYCKNKGECINTNNEVSCKCVDGYFGRKCGCSKDLCSNNGSCVELKNNLTQCQCQCGYSGATCKCHESYCKYGKCIEQKDGKIKCLCGLGYTGTRCKCSSAHCNNRGNCLEIGNDPICYCRKGYYGNTCACSNDYCKNNATCSDENGKAICACTGKYFGPRCLCHQNYCSSNQNCVVNTDQNMPTCQCKLGYLKPDCICHKNFCFNNGSCFVNSTTKMRYCNCKEKYERPRCEIPFKKYQNVQILFSRMFWSIFGVTIVIVIITCLYCLRRIYKNKPANLLKKGLKQVQGDDEFNDDIPLNHLFKSTNILQNQKEFIKSHSKLSNDIGKFYDACMAEERC